jgi:porphobilinogen synthase
MPEAKTRRAPDALPYCGTVAHATAEPDRRPRKTRDHARQPGPLPRHRFRRTRASASLRNLVRETELSVNDLIWPIFVRDGEGVEEPVVSMPGVVRRSVDMIVEAARRPMTSASPRSASFPIPMPSLKTELCEEAWNPDNLSNRAIRAVKEAVPELAIMTDIALDPYNANGHDGIVRDGVIVNDETVEALVKMALAQAEAGPTSSGPRT